MREQLKIGLIADVHLRATQYGNYARRSQICKTLCNLIEAAAERGVKYILCAGDFLDSNSPGNKIVCEDIPKIDKLLRNLGVSLIVSKGNHDTASPAWYNIIPGYVEEFGNSEKWGFASPGIVPLPHGKNVNIVPGLNVFGFDFISEDYFREVTTLPDMFANTNIVMAHGSIKDLCGYPTETAPTAQEIADAMKEHQECQLLVVGHIHKKKVFSLHGNQRIISPGSVDYVSMDEFNEPKSLTCAVFSKFDSDAGPKYILTDTEEVQYKHTEVVSARIETETIADVFIDLVRETSEKTDVGVIAYCMYSPSVKEFMHKVTAFVNERNSASPGCITLVTRLLPGKDKEYAEVDARELKLGPVVFFAEHAGQFIEDAEQRSRMMDLCCHILAANSDHKQVIEDYVLKHTNSIIV